MAVTLTEEFVEDIMGMLGGNLVDVELSETDLKVAYRQAKRTFKQKGADNIEKAFIKLDVVPSNNSYQLPEWVTDVNEIIHGRGFNGQIAEEPFSMATFQEVFNYGMDSSSGDMFYIYDLTKQTIENHAQYLAHEPNFRFNRRNKMLTLYNPPRRNQEWLLDVHKELTDAEYQAELWILNWTVAECKMILGRAYQKLGNVPSPTGESPLNGDQLIQEATQDKQELLEDIDNFVDAEPDGLGVYVG